MAVMATAGSPGGSSARNAEAWLVVTDEAVITPQAGSRRASRGGPPSCAHFLWFSLCLRRTLDHQGCICVEPELSRAVPVADGGQVSGV